MLRFITSFLSKTPAINIAIGVGLLALISFAGYLYYDYKSMQKTIQAQEERIEKMLDSINTLNKELKEEREVSNRVVERNAELHRELRKESETRQRQSREVAQLRARLERRKAPGAAQGSLARIARSSENRRQSLERVLNEGTARRLACIEIASGRQPTEEELSNTLFTRDDCASVLSSFDFN